MSADLTTSTFAAPPSKENRLAIKGFDSAQTTSFELRWSNNQLKLSGGATPKSTRFIAFYDANESSDKWLFVLPVVQDTFELEDKGGGRFGLKGKLRSFLPDSAVDFHHGWASFSFDVVASTDPAAFVLFRELKINGVSANNLQGSATALQAASIQNTHNTQIEEPRYLDAGLLNLEQASNSDVQKLRWNRRIRFTTLPGTSNANHATLILERLIEYPISRARHDFLPFKFSCEGKDFPVRRNVTGLDLRFAVFSQRLAADWKFETDQGTGNWLVKITCPQAPILDYWQDEIVDPIVAAINLIEAGRPLTTFPQLQTETPINPDQPPTWEAVFTFVDRIVRDEIKKADYVAGSVTSAGSVKADAVTIFPRAVTPQDASSRFSATFAAVRNHDGDPLLASFICQPFEFLSEQDYRRDDGQGIAFRLLQSTPGAQVNLPITQPVRMGAFDLNFLPAQTKTSEPIGVSLQWNKFSNSYFVWFETKKDNSFVATRARFRLAKVVLGINSVAPGGEDNVPGEEFAESEQVNPEAHRQPPLVFSLSTAIETQPAKANYRLELSETVQDGETQTINFELHEVDRTVDKSPARALIFDPEPWNVSLINGAPFSAADADQGTLIATWTNRADLGAGWQIQSFNSGFELVTPPQAIGEAMHRRREDEDILPNHPIDFRFAPPARLRLHPNTELRAAEEPGWNQRRITESALGAGASEIDFELLYGIWGELTSSKIRISEIAARLGQFPGVLPTSLPWPANADEQQLYENVRTIWQQLIVSMRRRVAVLEPWTPLSNSFFVKEDDGLQYRLRETASLQYPVPQEPGTTLPVFFKPDGLKGGWSWGFESRNILNAVTRDPKSYAGSLSDFYLSSFGGWGQQRAVFDRGLSTIISRVEMGRASSIVIERIGRISIFWNRAKHVIVYERTVGASRQFYQEQFPLVGNPVLRKVDEYIEILEPDRAFPENDAPIATRGFVSGCRFADGEPPRIRVNSRWGQDIGTTGWKIPLWLRGAQPEDVYPKPQILIMGAASIDERVPLALDDPDKLYFYTSTDQSLGADTNLWPAAEGVDFQAVNQSWLQPVPHANTSTDPANFKAADEPISSGLGAFTLRLQPAPAPVNYVEGRSDKNIRAVPHNVTVMRGAIIGNVDANALETKVQDLRSQLENAFSAFVTSEPLTNFDHALTEFDKVFAKAQVLRTSILDDLAGKDVCATLGKRVTAQFQQFADQIKVEVTSALFGFEREVDEVVANAFPENDLQNLKDKLQLGLQQIADDASGTLGQIRKIRGLPGEALAKIDDLIEDLRELNVRVDVALESALATIAALQDWVSPLPATDLPKARKVLADLIDTQIADFIQRSGFDYRLAEITRSWLGTLPDQITIKLDEARRACQAEFDKLRLLETVHRDDVLRVLQTVKGLSFDSILNVIEVLDNDWRSVFDSETEEPWPIETVLEGLTNQLSNVISHLESVDPAIVKNQLLQVTTNFFAGLDAQLNPLIAQTGASDVVGDFTRKICREVLADVEKIKQFLDAVFTGDRLSRLKDLLHAGVGPSEFFKDVDRVLTEMLDDVSGLVTTARLSIPAVRPPRTADDVLRLFRSFGEVPRLPQLQFNLPRIGYYFLPNGLDRFQPQIDLSPVAAAANQLGSQLLNGVSVSVPTRQLLDRLIPASFENFDLSKALPRMGGLDLSFLFKAIRMPKMSNDGVRVTHGIDENTRSAWLESDVNVSYTEPIPVFEFAGVKLVLLRANFKATIRLDVVLGQQPRQRTFGSIRGDWSLAAGGFDLVELNDCTLSFDEGGKIHFQITPAKVRLKPPLDFLSDILAPFGGSENGFHVSITPRGVQTALYLPVPNIQSGSFGVANLVLGFIFGLEIIDGFRIRTALQIGRPTHPFTLTVFILGGAGYFGFGLTYAPGTGQLTMDVSIAIFASASLAISLGPISGGVYAYFGVAIDYQTSNRGGSNLTITQKIIFTGEVSLLGFLSVGLTLGLDASYDQQKNLTGRGYIQMKVKIGWFIDITVNADVSYTFGKGTTTSSSTEIHTAADDYVGMFS